MNSVTFLCVSNVVERKNIEKRNKATGENNVVIYQDDNGITKVSVCFSDEDLWLTQVQITELYQTSKSNISEHLKNILADGELDEISVVRKFRTTAADGKKYNIAHYNLDMIIALGSRAYSGRGYL